MLSEKASGGVKCALVLSWSLDLAPFPQSCKGEELLELAKSYINVLYRACYLRSCCCLGQALIGKWLKFLLPPFLAPAAVREVEYFCSICYEFSSQVEQLSMPRSRHAVTPRKDQMPPVSFIVIFILAAVPLPSPLHPPLPTSRTSWYTLPPSY